MGKIMKNGISYVGGNSVDVINDLTSTSTISALSANQGRVLNESIDTTNDEVDKLKLVKLWENSSPTSTMATSATITLSSDDYDYLDIIYRRTTASSTVHSVTARKGDPVFLLSASISSASLALFQRALSITDDTTLSSGAPYSLSASTASFSRSSNAGVCIPVAIFGGHLA